MPEATLGMKVSGHAVFAFLSALSIALKAADRTERPPERRDLFLLVEAEIREFFEIVQGHDHLSLEALHDLDRIQAVLRMLYHDADLILLDPSEETPQ